MTLQEPTTEAKAWHALPALQTEAELGTDLESGLRSDEAARRLADEGPNVLQTQGGPSRFRLFLGQFADALIGVLLIAAFISGVILNDWVDAIVILAIVFMNATIGYTQESRAEARIGTAGATCRSWKPTSVSTGRPPRCRRGPLHRAVASPTR